MRIVSRRGVLRVPAFVAFLTVTLITAAAPHPSWSQEGSVQEAVQEGITLLQQGRIPEALERLRRAADAYPAEPLVWLALGQAYETARQPGEAIPHYRRVIELAPTSDDGRRARSRLDQLGPDRATFDAAQRDFQAAIQAYGANDLTGAEAGFRRVLDRIAKHLPSLLFLGNIAEQAGREDEARSRWVTAVTIEPTFYPAQVSLGRLYERQGQAAEAVTAYRAAADTRAEHPDVQFAAKRLTQLGATPEQALEVRGWMEEAAEALKAGRVEEARQAFDRVLTVLPNHAPATFALALMAAKRGQTIEAARLLRKGLEGAPDYYPSLFLLAEIEAGQGQFEEAIEHYRRVAELVGPRREGIEARRRLPGLEAALAQRKVLEVGIAAEARKSFDEGIEAFQRQDHETAFKAFTRATLLDEKNPFYVFNRGLAAFNLGNNLIAAKAFERVLEMAPTFGLAHFWLGVMFQASAEQARDARNLPEAQAEYKATVEKLDLAIKHGEGAWYIEEAEKRRAEAANFLARQQESIGFLTVGGVLGAQSRWDEALAVFGAAANRFPYDYQPFLNIGAILTERKQYQDAQAALEEAVRVNPESPKPYLQLGFLYETLERPDDAADMYRKVIELAPDAPQPYEALGAVMLLTDRIEQAVEAFEKSVEISGGTSSPRVHYSLATIYGQRGQRDVALRHYRKTRDLLQGFTEKEAVDIRRAAEESIALLEEQLRPWRFTLRATPWEYDSNVASVPSKPVGQASPPAGEATTQVGGGLTYYLITEPRFRLRGTLDHTETFFLLQPRIADQFGRVAARNVTTSTTTGLAANADYTLTPVIDTSGSYRWAYGHSSLGPEFLSQSWSLSVTRRGQLPSGLTLGLTYGISTGLGDSRARNASTGYSIRATQTLGEGGTVTTSFSASSSDSNRDDQVNLSKNIGVVYSRTLWGAVNASATYNLGLIDYVNPTRERDPTTGRTGLVFRQQTSKTYGLDLSYTFRNDLVISLGLNFQRFESNFALGQVEDPEELRNNLVQAAGSFRKRTMSVTVSKTF